MENIMQYKLITVIGGSGFVGSYIVKELAKDDTIINIISRDPDKALPIKVAGSVGQIKLKAANITDYSTIRALVAGSDAVINCVGILFEKTTQAFNQIHTEGARNVARACAVEKVSRLIHISALGVDHAYNSSYARSKFAGEKAVLEEFPKATILRPSVVFGAEDNFINKFVHMAKLSPALPLIGKGQTKFQPVYVGDLAKSVIAVLNSLETCSKIYDIAGPKIYNFQEILKIILRQINKKRILLPINWRLANLIGRLAEYMPHPVLTRDQVRLLKYDNVTIDNELGLGSLGIQPISLESYITQYIKDA
jgi:NADH dehydrogenase